MFVRSLIQFKNINSFRTQLINLRSVNKSCSTNFSTKPKGQYSNDRKSRSRDIALYGFTIAVLALSLTYASVPLYRLYCQATGKGGKARIAEDFLANKVKKMKKRDKIITVIFNADLEARMRWNFKPTQNEVKVYPGETALAFFTAKNPTSLPVNGVSTYSVAPVEAGQYLNKVQCFCFEEQRLEPGEEVDMPVFFYFDPEFADDPRMDSVDEVTLSYTFFEATEGFKIPTFPTNLQKPHLAIA